MHLKLKSYLNYPKCLLTLLIGLTNALITSHAFSDHFNATTVIYAKSFNPAMPMTMPISYVKPATANSRTARHGGGSLSNSCTTNDGVSGTCLSRFNCMRLGGSVKGSCPTFGGICCETNLQCGQTSKMKRTIIRNPAQFSVTDCLYVIEPYSNNVCQLLVEFENFQLQQPQSDGTTMLECLDYFEIGDYKLCGNNDGQHLYLQFNVASGIRNFPLNFRIPTRWSQTNWRLVVTQLECPAVKRRLNLSFLPFVTDNSLTDARTVFNAQNSDWDILAPPGCDQYFRATSGFIKSFNYNENQATPYMQNLNYVICIKPMPGATSIEYTMRQFSLGLHNSVQTTFGFDTDCRTLITMPSGRDEDYLMIPQSTLVNLITDPVRPTYYCGVLPNRPVITAPPPFIMYFNSDEVTRSTESGFGIDYRVKSVLG